MALRIIKNRYYMYFRDEHGKLRTIATHASLNEKDEALAFEKEYMTQLRAKKRRLRILKDFPEYAAIQPEAKPDFVAEAQQHKRGGIKLSEMLDCALNKQPSISKDIRDSFTRFVKSVNVKYADQVTPLMVQNYLEKNYSGKDRNNVSYNKHRGHLNRIFRLCLVEAQLLVSPVQSVVCRKIKRELVKHRDMMSYSDFEYAIKHLTNLTDLFMLMSCRWTTQRLETCARFTLSMFDFEKKVFIIDPSKTKIYNDKFVCVPIFPEYEKFLIDRIIPVIKDKSPNIPIVKHLGYYSTNDHFSRHINRELKNLKISKTFQSCRSTGITWMKEQGIPYEIRTDITGHTAKETEDIYARAIEQVSIIARGMK